MSRLEIPEHLRPLAPGYSPRQVELDAQMVALGRPSLGMRAALVAAACIKGDRKALDAHEAAVEAWEYANPDNAAKWLELRAEAQAEEARLFSERYGPEAFAAERMRIAGFSETLVARCLRELRDTVCFTSTRDWLKDGTTWCLTLTGPPGCGKTQAATWAAHQLLMRGFGPRFVQCLKRSEAALYGMEAEEYRWRTTQAGVLVLDDMGEGEQRNEKRAAWRAWLDDVLTQRHAQNRRTIVTTNRTTGELRDWLGTRLVDRINEGVIISTNEASMRGQRETGGGK